MKKYYVDRSYYDVEDDAMYGDIAWSTQDMWNETECDSLEDAIDGTRRQIEEENNHAGDDGQIPVFTVCEFDCDEYGYIIMESRKDVKVIVGCAEDDAKQYSLKGDIFVG